MRRAISLSTHHRIDHDLRALIKILLWQLQCLISELPVLCMIGNTVFAEHATIQPFTQACLITALELFPASFVRLLGRLMRDVPIRLLRACHTQDRVEHLVLGQSEGLNVDVAIAELLEAWFADFLSFDWKAKKARDCASNLWPGRGGHRCITAIVQGYSTICNVEAIGIRDCQTPLIPEPMA